MGTGRHAALAAEQIIILGRHADRVALANEKQVEKQGRFQLPDY